MTKACSETRRRTQFAMSEPPSLMTESSEWALRILEQRLPRRGR